jgi:hypothetical protein
MTLCPQVEVVWVEEREEVKAMSAKTMPHAPSWQAKAEPGMGLVLLQLPH